MQEGDRLVEVYHEHDNPEPLFLGFCPKEYRLPPQDWWRDGWAVQVTEICSVADCIAGRPDWIDQWTFNRASCWDDEAAALALVPTDERHRYRLYAYRAIPLLFDKSGTPIEQAAHALFLTDMPALPAEPDLSGYECLGYDVVQYDQRLLGFGCSPLSCNGMGGRYPINRFCLLDRLAVAYDAARAFGREEAEPGPYIIVEVRRKLANREGRQRWPEGARSLSVALES